MATSYLQRIYFIFLEFCSRAKLFEYGETLLDKGTGNKTWKEKGIGEAKFLKSVILEYCIVFTFSVH